MIKSLFTILLFLLSLFGFSQTKIRLKSPTKMQEDYQTENISDTIFIKIWHMEDMGSWYGHSYELKNSIPDGQYEIYVDDILRLSAFIKNSHKDSIWTKFFPNGNILSSTSYHNDMVHGKLIEYYKNGVKQKEMTFSFDCPINEEINYFESGKIKSITKEKQIDSNEILSYDPKEVHLNVIDSIMKLDINSDSLFKIGFDYYVTGAKFYERADSINPYGKQTYDTLYWFYVSKGKKEMYFAFYFLISAYNNGHQNREILLMLKLASARIGYENMYKSILKKIN